MPNWCMNNLKINTNGEKALEILELLKNDKGEMTFEKFMPMPKELDTTSSPVRDTVPEEERKKLVEKYGADNWYDWRCKNWGCKWDAQDSEFRKVGDDWIITFHTPWGPPIEFVKALSKKFKEFGFSMQYADENMGQSPLGEAEFYEGTVSYDGPEEGTDEAEEFTERVWDGEWIDYWEELGNKEERLKYLLEKERVCDLDKEERYELEKLKGGIM